MCKEPDLINQESKNEPVITPDNAPAQNELITQETRICTRNGIEGEIFSISAMFPDIGSEKNPLVVMKATSDPDTMYMHEAMREPDKEHFKKAMKKEWNDQLSNGNFVVRHKSEIPIDATILPAVWQMKRKRDIISRAVKKYKARMNIDGSKMRLGVHYDETRMYAPVASWNSVKLLLSMVALHDWHTTQIDYVLAFLQAPVARTIYMKIPKGFEIEEGSNDNYVLKIRRNIYGQVNAGRVWNNYLTDKLINRLGFVQSKVDKCMFFKGKTIYLLYTNDSILARPDKKEIENIIKQIKEVGLDITVEGDIQDFLGVNITRNEDGSILLHQPHLVDKILEDLRLNDERVSTKDIPMASSRLLSYHVNSTPFDGHFDYRSVIGNMLYLEKGTRPDIAYATHQCARFSSDPKKEHGKAVKWLGRYLKGTRDRGLLLRPDKTKGLEVYVDASFAGDWDKKMSHEARTARSRHGYVIYYAGCPILAKSQLQTESALSTTESEYTGASYAL